MILTEDDFAYAFLALKFFGILPEQWSGFKKRQKAFICASLKLMLEEEI